MSTVLDNIAIFPVPAQKEPQEEQRKKDNDGIHKRRGIWHFKIKVAGRWKEMSTHTSNYQEARKYRNKTIRAQEEGRLPTEMANWTFTKVAEQWIEARKKLVSVGTWRIDKNRLQRLKEAFADKRLIQITASEIETYRMRRLENVSPATINSETKVLRLILKTAKVWAQIADDIKPLRESKDGPGRVLSQAEEKRLFETAITDEKANTVYLAAIVAANTSARGGELKRLRLKDVDVLNKTLTIRRDSTKTDASCRIIPLNTTATLALGRLLDRASKLKSLEPEHYLFPGSPFRRTKDAESHRGSGYDPSTHQVSWRTSWRNLVTKAGLPKLRFHDLRHHCITRLAENGVPDQTVMAISGHVSKAMLDHYSHVRMQARRNAVAALDSVQLPAANEAKADQPTTENVNDSVHMNVHTEVNSTT
jgi:integrase